MIKLDHVGIVVSDLEKGIKIFSETFGHKPRGPKRVYEIKEPGVNIKYALLGLGDTAIDLMEPGEGDRSFLPFITEEGKGAIMEICFEVDDIEAFYDRMKEKGITLLDWPNGNPLVDQKYVLAPSGNKIAYLPCDTTLGLWVEVTEKAWHY